MLYYKLLDIKDYDKIVEKCLHFVKAIDIAYHRKLPKASWYGLEVEKLSQACPELVTAMAEYDLKVHMAAVYVMYDSKHTSIHIDSYPSKARINFPLLNCVNTYTNFYESEGEPIKIVNPESGMVSYNPSKTPILVDRVEMKQATLIRTKVFHSVDLPIGNPVPRITLTLGFNKDPVYMLE